jgi:hypothetical protein
MARQTQTPYSYEPGKTLELLNPYVLSPHEVKGNDLLGYKFIAQVWGSWNGWCAYRGLATWTDSQVADYGDEIPYELAIMIFPVMEHAGRSYGGG